MPHEPMHATLLMCQRQAVIRAIQRAREYRADYDADILETVAELLDSLREMTERQQARRH